MDIQQLINTYKMSDTTKRIVASTKLLLIAGIVGGGKNTVINELLKSDDYHLIVSHTTRAPRVNHGIPEQDEIDYHFIDQAEASRMLQEKEFVEAKYVHGNVYGTSAAELARAQEAGRIAVTDIDVHGVVEYLDIKPDTHAIFLLPPSVDTWLKRLERRYGDLEAHHDEISRRFRTAQAEIRHIQEDHRFVLVVNDDLETTIERVQGVLDGSVDSTSDYAEAVTAHLLDYLDSKI